MRPGIRGRVRLRHRGTIRWCVSIGDPQPIRPESRVWFTGASNIRHFTCRARQLSGGLELRGIATRRMVLTGENASIATVGERDRRQARLRHRRHEPPSPRGAPWRPACDDRLPAHDLRDRSHHADAGRAHRRTGDHCRRAAAGRHDGDHPRRLVRRHVPARHAMRFAPRTSVSHRRGGSAACFACVTGHRPLRCGARPGWRRDPGHRVSPDGASQRKGRHRCFAFLKTRPRLPRNRLSQPRSQFLVATDGTHDADGAVRVGHALAQRDGVKADLLSVVEPPPFVDLDGMPIPDADHLVEITRESREAALLTQRDRTHPGIQDWPFDVGIGPRVETIVERTPSNSRIAHPARPRRARRERAAHYAAGNGAARHSCRVQTGARPAE